MTNISAVEKMAELMQQIEVNSPRVAALHYCLSETARHIAELEQKLAESQREFRAADATIENLQMQLEKMAAENAGLKEACGGDGSYRDCPACAHSEYIEAPETPTTDAFLAEVRAQGVEMFAEVLKNSGAAYQREFYADTGNAYIEASKDAVEFAAQLRKGGAS